MNTVKQKTKIFLVGLASSILYLFIGASLTFASTSGGECTDPNFTNLTIINSHSVSFDNAYYNCTNGGFTLGVNARPWGSTLLYIDSGSICTQDGNHTVLDWGSADSFRLTQGTAYNFWQGGNAVSPNRECQSITYTGPQITANSSTSTVTEGTPFTVDIVVDGAGTVFNAAQADISISTDKLAVNNIFLHPSSNACDFHYTTTPTSSNPSFAGAIFGTSTVTSCKVYTLSLTPTSAGTGTISITNAHIKAYSDSSELLSSTTQPDVTFTINAASPTVTPIPTTALSQPVVTSPLKTYLGDEGETYTLAGTYLYPITYVFIDTSESGVTAENGDWSKANLTLTLGTNNTAHDNTFTIFGRDDENNQTASQVVHVERHLRGDINGDGNRDLIDASLFAVDWGKTSNLTNVLSDMNTSPDGVVDLSDYSILAKLIQ